MCKTFRPKKVKATLFLTTDYFRDYVREIQKSYLKSKCCITGKRKGLTVHHVIPYKTLIQEAFKQAGIPYQKKVAGLTSEQESLIVNELIKLHKAENLYTVHSRLHRLYHERYDLSEANAETWKEFMKYQRISLVEHGKGK